MPLPTLVGASRHTWMGAFRTAQGFALPAASRDDNINKPPLCAKVHPSTDLLNLSVNRCLQKVEPGHESMVSRVERPSLRLRNVVSSFQLSYAKARPPCFTMVLCHATKRVHSQPRRPIPSHGRRARALLRRSFDVTSAESESTLVFTCSNGMSAKRARLSHASHAKLRLLSHSTRGGPRRSELPKFSPSRGSLTAETPKCTIHSFNSFQHPNAQPSKHQFHFRCQAKKVCPKTNAAPSREEECKN